MTAVFANVSLKASRRRSLCFVHVPEKGAIKADAIALGTENCNNGVAMIKVSTYFRGNITTAEVHLSELLNSPHLAHQPTPRSPSQLIAYLLRSTPD